MKWRQIKPTDNVLYRGVAILMIVIHNFMYLFEAPKHNEFSYHSGYFSDFIKLIVNEPENLLRSWFSFFGHFGVVVFIFLSAYGLTKKFMDSPDISYKKFVFERICKLYPYFITSVVAWLLIDGWSNFGQGGPYILFVDNFYSILCKAVFISNFLVAEVFRPVGPWWFLPFIFQFYFIFPFLYLLYSKRGNKVLLLLALLSLLSCMLLSGMLYRVQLSHTFWGHMPEICLGMYLATIDRKETVIPNSIILSTFILFLWGNVYEPLWYMTHVCFLAFLLVLLQKSYKLPKLFRKVLMFYGTISLPLFLVNGFLRSPFIFWAFKHNNWLATIGYCMVFLGVSTLVSIIVKFSTEFILARYFYTKVK